ncbi:MAG: GGDEF domain-containing protein [Sheuella sp.]|nr:GGDEF domain-containing protein [Sheuella sp.]
MLYLSAFFYLISLLCQVGAAILSIRLIKHTAYIYRWTWLCLALGLTLMLGSRIDSLYKVYLSDHYMLTDALLSAPISALLLIGIMGISKIIFKINSNNDFLSALSQLDPLTQCQSRTEILFRIHEEIKRSERNNRPFALMEMDIDHFKDVNDKYGHDIGDQVLISLSRNTKDVIRTIDSVGRIGGEEFLILLPETDSKQATEAAERLRAQIANVTHANCASNDVRITISIGVTVFYPDKYPQMLTDEISTEIIKQADMAMYQAKNAGRNRVAMWSQRPQQNYSRFADMKDPDQSF